ncbi:MAG TPA: hypothetical protein VFQ22_10530 [Longimicrobiales bacterium]|nr:hypothetical protein [Longimicrobiales bacterium]
MARVTSPPEPATRDERVQPEGPTLAEDLAFEAFYGGAIGGSTIALFFLLVDGLQGRPLFTPSLIGHVLFTDLPATEIAPIRYDMVAYFSIVHFAAFGALGAIASLFYRYVARGSRAALTAAFMFVLLTAVILLADWLFMPGVVVAAGVGNTLAANALTAVAMAAFLHVANRRG